MLDGTVIGRNMQRHRHQEFIRFLNAIEAEVPAGKVVHMILDNYAAHKHPKVCQWLARQERFNFHFTPTSCSWINAVEGFFAKLTKRRLRRGVFHSVADLQAAINRFLDEHNGEAKLFTWTADFAVRQASVTRFAAALPFAFILAPAHACAVAFSALALLDELLHALAALVTEFRIAFGAQLLLARLTALLAHFGIALVAELCLADLAAYFADLGVAPGPIPALRISPPMRPAS